MSDMTMREDRGPQKSGRRRGGRRVLATLLTAIVGLSVGITPARSTPYGDPDRSERVPVLPSDVVTATFSAALNRGYHDRDGDRFPDPARTPEEVRKPTSWPVSLDACDSQGGTSEIIAYVWRVNGHEARQSDCAFTWQAPGEGTYPVSLTVHTKDGRQASVSEAVSVKDFLIVVLGDSAASGEGNPHRSVAEGGPTWEDQRCHRSAHAGMARAAQAIEFASASSVTLVNLACSGARITEGLLAPYKGVEPDAPDGWIWGRPPQLEQLWHLVGGFPQDGGRLPDVVLMSIGINDLDFANIATACVLIGGNGSPKDCSAFERATAPPNVSDEDLYRYYCEGQLREFKCLEMLKEGLYGIPGDVNTPIGRLPGRYDELNARLKQLFPALAADRILLTEYPDNTHTRNPSLTTPQLCEVMLEDSPPEIMGVKVMGAVNMDKKEAGWASRVVVQGLNTALANAARKHGWRVVDTIANSMLFNGYCAPDGERKFRRWDESEKLQGSYHGALHPNRAGHDVIRDRVLESLGRVDPASNARPPLPFPPSITVTGVAEEGFGLVGLAPRIDVYDPVGLAAPPIIKLDGSPYTSGSSITSVGRHTLRVEATSLTGPTSVLTIPFTLGPPTVSDLAVAPASVTGGAPARGTVKIAGTSPGVEISLRSSDPSVASVPSSVRVMNGSNSASFAVDTKPIPLDKEVTITASTVGTTGKSVALKVTAPRLASLSVDENPVIIGQSIGGTVELTGLAPVNGLNITLASSNPTAVKVPGSVSVTAGAKLAQFTVTTGGTQSTTATITATDSFGETRTISLEVQRPVFQPPPCLRCDS